MRPPRVHAAVLLLALSAAAAPARTELDVSVSTVALSAPTAVVATGIRLGSERLVGDDRALAWSAALGGRVVPAEGSLSATAALGLDLSLTVPNWTLVGRAGCEAAAGTVDGIGPVSAAIGVSLVRDGESAGLEIAPRLEAWWAAEPGIDLSLATRLTFLAGCAVLEPGITAGLRRDTQTEVRIEPGLGISWYPGIPLALETGLRWTGTVDEGVLASNWGATLSAAGALGGVVLFTATGSLGLGPDGWSVDADAEVAFVLGSIGSAEVSLPVTGTASSTGDSPATVGVGAGLRVCW